MGERRVSEFGFFRVVWVDQVQDLAIATKTGKEIESAVKRTVETTDIANSATLI